MTIEGGIDRRALLRLLVALGLAGRFLARRRPSVAGEPPGSLPELFADRESAVVLGGAYLELRPEERATPILLERLGLTREALNEVAERERVLDGLRQRHRDDFRMGRIVELQGWFLSETELRLSALVFLSDGGAVDP
jgi:hypothetical protein